MIKFPDVFKFGFADYSKKSEAAADAERAWGLCQAGEKLPGCFKKGMELISVYLEEPINPDNCKKLRIKHKIKEDRAARGMTQAKYAQLLGVKENTVCNWETGRRAPELYVWLLLTFSTEALQVAAAKVWRK